MMPVYEISGDQMAHLSHGRLADLKKGDRKDFLALLRENIQVLSNDLLLVSDDSDQWNKSEEIDLLAIDKNSNLVAIEVLEAGSKDHESLPIVRYGTLASKFTFGNLVETYQAHLKRTKRTGLDAKKSIIDHWGATLTGFKNEELLDLRIFFVSREFTDETIKTVDWIRNNKLDIRCIQMSSFEFGDRSIIDIDQLVPKIEGDELAKLLQRKLNPVTIKSDTTGSKPDSAKTEKIETEAVPSKPSVEVKKPEPTKTKSPVASPKETAVKSEQQKSKATATSAKSPQTSPKSTSAEPKKSAAKSTSSKVAKTAPTQPKQPEKKSVTKPAPSKPVSKPISTKAKAASAKSSQTKTSGSAKKSGGAPQLDRARYYVTFNGAKQQPTAKRRVVLQTITHLIKNGIKPSKFPERIAGTDDIFVCVKGNVNSEKFIKLAQVERKKVNRTFDSKRYFCRDDELIKLGNLTYAVINQWTLEGFKEIMNLLKNDYPKFKINYRREEK